MRYFFRVGNVVFFIFMVGNCVSWKFCVWKMIDVVIFVEISEECI